MQNKLMEEQLFTRQTSRHFQLVLKPYRKNDSLAKYKLEKKQQHLKNLYLTNAALLTLADSFLSHSKFTSMSVRKNQGSLEAINLANNAGKLFLQVTKKGVFITNFPKVLNYIDKYIYSISNHGEFLGNLINNNQVAHYQESLGYQPKHSQKMLLN